MAVEGAAAVSAAHEAGRGPDRRGLSGRDQHAGSVKRALFGLFQGAVGKDVVSRAWRKVKVDRDAWCGRSLAGEDIVRLILDGTVIRTRWTGRPRTSPCWPPSAYTATARILLSIRHMGGRASRPGARRPRRPPRLKRPDFVIVDGAPGLEAALTALWGAELPIQRCTVHKHRNLLGHAPKRLHDELTEECRDMIYAETAAEVETRRKAFLRKWRLKCSGRRRQPRGSRGAAVRLHPPRSVAMEIGPDHQRHRAAERGIPPAHRDPDRAALRRDRAHAALGPARLRPDRHAQGRRMGDPLPAHRALRP